MSLFRTKSVRRIALIAMPQVRDGIHRLYWPIQSGVGNKGIRWHEVDLYHTAARLD